MSPQHLAGVRTPVDISVESRRRTLNERILVRFPALARASLLAWARLPRRSRLRRLLLARNIRQGFEAWNRRDWELLLVLIDPEIEYRTEQSPLGGADLVGTHRGHEGYLRAFEAVIEGIRDLKIVPDEVIDFGDHLLTAGRGIGHGSSSGVPVDEPVFQLYTMRAGLVIRQQDFANRNQALEAVGLSE